MPTPTLIQLIQSFTSAILISTATLLGAAEITLTWNDNSDNETGFAIERKTDSSSYSEIATVDANSSSYIDSEINDTDTFYYRVKAFNESSSSGYTNTASATLAPQNDSPTISSIDNQSLLEGESIVPISFTISDTETSASLLDVTGSSSNQSLLSDSNIVILGTGSDRSISINPTIGAAGTSTITIEVSDGVKTTSETFLFSISTPFSTSDLWLGMAFDEENGNNVIDSSVNGNNASTTEGVLHNDSGRFNSALEFSGSGGRVDLGTMDIPGSALTISAWIKPNSFDTSDARIISKATTTTDKDHNWMLSTLSDNGSKARMRLRTTNGDTTTLVGSINLVVGEWQYITGTYDGENMRLYVNGELAGAAAKTGEILQSPTVPVAIGNQPQGNRSFDGLIDEVRIYTAALTEDEILDVMNAPIIADNNETIEPVPPVIDSQPLDTTADEGTLAVFLVQTSGENLSYQWSYNGSEISGATSASFSILNTNPSDAGLYSVTVSNDDGSVESSSAQLTVIKKISEAQKTIVQTTNENGQVQLSVAESGLGLTYQWYLGETGDSSSPIEGETFSSFTPNERNTNANYWVKVSLDNGNLQNVDTFTSGTFTIPGIPTDRYYFGDFDSANGSFGLMLREDDTAVFIAEVADPKIVIATTELEVSADGEFSYNSGESGWIDGLIDGDIISGTIRTSGITFSGVRSNSDGPTKDLAGTYDAKIANTSDGQMLLLAGPDGTSYILVGAGDEFSGREANLEENGDITTPTQESNPLTLTLDTSDGTLSGTTTFEGVEYNILGQHEDVTPENHLVNTSVRAQVKGGAGAMIAGFVITGEGEKQVLIRGVGPSLSKLNVSTAIEDTKITLYRMGEIFPVAENDDWATSGNADQISTASDLVGAFQLDRGSKDSALLLNLPEGVYTAMVSNGTGIDGTALVEVYDMDEVNEVETDMELVNMSLRGEVASGANVIIGGFVVQGDSPKRLLIRAMGSELSNYGVENTLSDPQLTLYRSINDTFETIAFNDSWSDDAELLQEASLTTGAFEFDEGSTSSAQVIWLEPGVYTAMASSGDGTSGVALIEVYQLP